MTQSKKPEIRLGRIELQIMNVVWEQGSATVHDVKEALGHGRKPAYSTILTMMRKLEIKGYLKHTLQERTFIYHPIIDRQEVRHTLVGDLLDRLFEGSPSLLVSSLIEQKKVNGKELEAIRKLIEERGTDHE